MTNSLKVVWSFFAYQALVITFVITLVIFGNQFLSSLSLEEFDGDFFFFLKHDSLAFIFTMKAVVSI